MPGDTRVSLDRATSILLKWECRGGPMDPVVIDALGRSGSPKALEWIKNLRLPPPCAEAANYMRALSVARARLEPNWIEKQLSMKDSLLNFDYDFWDCPLPATPRCLALLRDRANNGDWYARSKLFEVSPEYRHYCLHAIANSETWPVDDLWPGFLSSFPPEEIMPVLGPRFSDVDERIQTEILLAFFDWPPTPWDAEFHRLIATASHPEEALFLLSPPGGWHSPEVVHPSARRPTVSGEAVANCCRCAHLLLDVYQHSRSPVAVLMAAGKLLGHGPRGGSISLDPRETRRKLDRALADPHPERWTNGGTDAIARVGRWLISQGERFAPDDFVRVARAAPAQDRLEAVFTLGYLLDQNSLRSAIRKLHREVGHEGWDWWMMKRLACSVAGRQWLHDLSYDRLRESGGLQPLWWNQVTGLKPDLSDWIATASGEDRLSLAEHVFFFRPDVVPRNILELFGGWQGISTEPEATWGRLLCGRWGTPAWAAEISHGLDSCHDARARAAAFTWLLETGQQGTLAALTHFRQSPDEVHGQVLYEQLNSPEAADHGRQLMDELDPLISIVGAALCVRSYGTRIQVST